jgi:ketosteroid isomerase-like protein
MSRENVEIVHRIYDSWASGDFRSPAEHFDRHAVLVLRPEFPDSGAFHGLDEIGEFNTRFLDQWERLTMEAKKIRAVGDTVIVRVAQRGKGKASGVEVEDTFFTLLTFRGQKIVRMENVRDEGEARKAVGLSEQAAHADLS